MFLSEESHCSRQFFKTGLQGDLSQVSIVVGITQMREIKGEGATVHWVLRWGLPGPAGFGIILPIPQARKLRLGEGNDL